MRVPIVMLSGAAGSGKDTVADFLVKNHGAVKIAQADPMKRLAMTVFGFTEDQLWGPSERRDEPSETAGGWRADFIPGWIRDVLPGWPEDSLREAQRKLWSWWNPLVLSNPKPSGRRVLQTLGTEWGRAFSRDMWVQLALSTTRKLLGGGYVYRRDVGLAANEDDACNLVVITDGRFRNELLAVRAAGGATVKIVSPGAGLAGEAANHASEAEQNSIPDNWFDVIFENKKEHGHRSLEIAVDGLVHYLSGSTDWHSTFEGYKVARMESERAAQVVHTEAVLASALKGMRDE